MRCRYLFAPLAAILRALHAPGAIPPIPREMQKALASIDNLERVADEKIARIQARNIQMANVADDLASHR